MEDNLDALDNLFDFGSCTYTTIYKDFHCTVTIRVVTVEERYYNYVFSTWGIRQAILDMLEQSISSKQECITFTACMSEELPPIELPIEQMTVHQLTSLEIEVRKSMGVDSKDTLSSQITTKFSAFNSR